MNLNFSEFLHERARIINEHRRIILEMRTIEQEISERLKRKGPSWRELEKKRNALYIRIEPLVEKYWNILPSVELSRCPYCDQRLFRLFDTVDLNGFWWMDRTQRPRLESSCCAHFCLLTGALNFNNLPAVGGLFECLLGPDAPFVIPRILNQPTMQAVVSCIKMQCGYSAYPVAYFAEKPPVERNLTQSWARKEFRFTDGNGKSGWDIKDESYDYALASWIKLGKLKVHFKGKLNPSADDLKECDFLNIKGILKSQVLIDNQLRFR